MIAAILDMLEHYFDAHGWAYERAADEEIVANVQGSWAQYELRAVWRVPPAPPSLRVPGIPPELDRLVLSMLSLEPAARPSSAAEVLDRLAAIAGLPRDEQPAVTHAEGRSRFMEEGSWMGSGNGMTRSQ